MTEQMVKGAVQERESREECRHHWIIETADGPVSRGICKLCGAKKEFSNSLPDFTTVRRHSSVFELPRLPDIDFDEERNSS